MTEAQCKNLGGVMKHGNCHIDNVDTTGTMTIGGVDVFPVVEKAMGISGDYLINGAIDLDFFAPAVEL
eukprot:CAMPEP_0119407438 /NCGR_PEP_ID=MMETSP1335-20130426/1313_1 /TAXON_ID=259385 /ORGANISM="Chrysoculter rhomboideus, Strain RCC1486" /LENGTH=67 /DNA_ID=CAMNT_0007431543 /DNA_START=306 /DNA_END=509 /DNA_ORIENTATION=-